MIRAILSSFASEKSFLCSAALYFYPCILNFCHWHCKLFCHLAEQYSTDYFHVYACRKTDICSDNLLTSHIASWIFFAQDGIRLSRVIALFNLYKWFLISDACMHYNYDVIFGFHFFFLRKNGDIIWVKWKLTCEFEKKKTSGIFVQVFDVLWARWYWWIGLNCI